MSAPAGIHPEVWQKLSQRLGKKTYSDDDVASTPVVVRPENGPKLQPAPSEPPAGVDPAAYADMSYMAKVQAHSDAQQASAATEKQIAATEAENPDSPNYNPYHVAQDAQSERPSGAPAFRSPSTVPSPPPAEQGNDYAKQIADRVFAKNMSAMRAHGLEPSPAEIQQAQDRAWEVAHDPRSRHPSESNAGYFGGVSDGGGPSFIEKLTGSGHDEKDEHPAANRDAIEVSTGEDNPQGASQEQVAAPSPPQQMVPAHEEPRVNPERQAELTDAIGQEEQARLAEGGIKENAMNVGAEGQMDAANQEAADLDRIAENQKARQAYLDRLGQDIDDDSKSMSQQKVDPERFWASRTTAQKILGVIAMTLGGFVQGVHGGRNGPADMIQQSIEEDINAQKSNIENQWQDVRHRQSTLNEKAVRYGSMDVAERQQVAARLQGALLMAQAAATRATSPVERANALALAAQLQQKAIMAGIEMNKWVNAGYANGGGGSGDHPSSIKREELVAVGKGADGNTLYIPTGDPERARAINRSNDAGRSVAGFSSEMADIIKNHPVEAYSPFSPQYGRLRALSAQLAMADVQDAAGGSAGGGRSLGAMKLFIDKQGIAQGKAWTMLGPAMQGKTVAALESLAHGAKELEIERMKEYDNLPLVVVKPHTDAKGVREIKTFVLDQTYHSPKGGVGGGGQSADPKNFKLAK